MRALDVVLKQMDMSGELCNMESVKKMASGVVNLLSGRTLTTTTTTTTTTATTTTTPIAPLKEFQRDSTTT
ncbi:hypothetical protein Sjap_004727 [Stephania japonica]|uniref:Uncharacterized protein n=1 Tax=Stephania japonica TaxID=461633 RepID=A0AAP0K429_9MAGN